MKDLSATMLSHDLIAIILPLLSRNTLNNCARVNHRWNNTVHRYYHCWAVSLSTYHEYFRGICLECIISYLRRACVRVTQGESSSYVNTFPDVPLFVSGSGEIEGLRKDPSSSELVQKPYRKISGCTILTHEGYLERLPGAASLSLPSGRVKDFCLSYLPFDHRWDNVCNITYIDEENVARYYEVNQNRVYAHVKIIGNARTVFCHGCLSIVLTHSDQVHFYNRYSRAPEPCVGVLGMYVWNSSEEEAKVIIVTHSYNHIYQLKQNGEFKSSTHPRLYDKYHGSDGKYEIVY